MLNDQIPGLRVMGMSFMIYSDILHGWIKYFCINGDRKRVWFFYPSHLPIKFKYCLIQRKNSIIDNNQPLCKNKKDIYLINPSENSVKYGSQNIFVHSKED